MQQHDPADARFTVVTVDPARRHLAMVGTQPVNFHEFAVFFRDSLHCPDALYFDETISSMSLPELQSNDGAYKLGPIIGVIE